MQLNIFGFEIRKTPEAPALVPENKADGAIEQFTGAGAAHYAHVFDINGRLNDDVAKINRYRQLSHVAEIDSAIEEIVTEAIVVEEEKLPVQVNVVTGDETIPEQIKEAIVEEFKNILALMEFNTEGHDLFRRWYVDGRLYGQMLVDESDLASGIKDIRFIDPRKIKKVREIQRQKNSAGVDIIMGTTEYFAFNDAGINTTNTAAIKLSPDNIIYAPSGITDESGETIGYLNKTIKPANMLRYMEDAVLVYTLARAPERRVFYIDVADIPKQKADQYIRDVMARYKNKIVYNQATGEVSDDRVHQSIMEDFWLPRRCFSMDTQVKLLDGRDVSIQQLSEEYQQGKKNWTYSVSDDGVIVPGLITWAGVTMKNANVVDVHLDNGQVITCTPDHKFVMRNGQKVQAQYLTAGSSLMPIYTDKKVMYGNTEYMHVLDNKTNKWKPTHRMVSEYMNRESRNNEVVHHADFNRFNNNPDNLVIMDKTDHIVLHAKEASKNWETADEKKISEWKAKLSKSGKDFFLTPEGEIRIDISLSPSRTHCAKNAEAKNHKVVKVVIRSDVMDVGTLTVDGDELNHSYHNYALTAGVFVMNSNGRSTEITTLPGSSIMSNMDNVNYFLNKLYAALNVPMSRMKADAGFNLGRTSEITRDEIKFNKFVSRLRRKFSEVFYQALRVQLILKGIIAPEDWQFIKSKINFDFLRDNYFSELKDNEILTGRIQMAEMIQPYMDKYYSHKYVRTMILKQTEEEMEDMDKEREIEMKQHPEWFMPPGMDMGGSPGQPEQQ